MIQFMAANWLWIALVVAMFAMHRHGGCGGHGRHGTPHRHQTEAHHEEQPSERDTERADSQSQKKLGMTTDAPRVDAVGRRRRE